MKPNPPSILLVDDDIDICSNMLDILIDLGYHVESANDGATALEMIRQNSYDVAVLDYKMPGMNGVALLHQIRKTRPEMVSLLVTAYAGSAADDAMSAGVSEILSKPVEVTRLIKIVGEAVDRPLILIVDDDRELCSNLWDLMKDRGYRVGLAHDGEEAARRLAESIYDVVLIDIKLPDCNGSGVFRKVCEVNPEARTLLITGEVAETGCVVDQILAEGADAVHYKPFDVPKLLETLERLIKARLGREAS